MKASIAGTFALLLLSAVSTQAQTVADAIKAAEDKEHDADWAGAINIYDQIIQQFPKEFPEVYAARASDRSLVDDDKGAIADYTKALELDNDPKGPILNHGHIYGERAQSKDDIGDEKGAIVDYHLAIKANPTDSFMIASLAEVELGIKDCAAANTDYSQAIALAKPPEVLYFENRGIAHLCLGDVANSYSDYQAAVALEVKETPPPLMTDMFLTAWALGAHLGVKDDADKALTEQLTETKPEASGADRERDAANVFLGKSDIAVLMKDADEFTAGDKDNPGDIWISNANYYAGLKAVGDGDTKGSIASFQKVVSAKRNLQYVRLLATSWIKVLGGAPAAPTKKK